MCGRPWCFIASLVCPLHLVCRGVVVAMHLLPPAFVALIDTETAVFATPAHRQTWCSTISASSQTTTLALR